MAGSPLFIGLDIGGTKIEAIAADPRFAPCGSAVRASDISSPAALVAAIEHAAAEASGGAPIAAAGVGIPGLVEPESGEVRMAVNLRLEHYPLGEALAARFGCPVRVENDVRLAAWGAYRELARQTSIRHMAYLSIGTGVSAGIIIDGRLHRGAHGMAGEIGHMSVDPNGPLCNCGQRGCLETFVAGPGIARLGRQSAAVGRAPALAGLAQLGAAEIYAAAEAGDPGAQEVVAYVGALLGRTLEAMVLAYDPQRIVLAGGVAKVGAPFLRPILAEWERRRQDTALARTLLLPEKLALADPHRNMGAWGGIYLAADALAESA